MVTGVPLATPDAGDVAAAPDAASIKLQVSDLEIRYGGARRPPGRDPGRSGE